MTLNEYRAQIKQEMGSEYLVPNFDLSDGASSQSRFLFMLEAPGPKVLNTELISLNNPDPTARNLKKQLSESDVDLSEVVLWNTVPWINRSQVGVPRIRETDIIRASKFFPLLPKVFQNLEAIVFLGDVAVKQLVHYCIQLPKVRFCMAHHPSAMAMAGRPDRWDRNVSVFTSLKG